MENKLVVCLLALLLISTSTHGAPMHFDAVSSGTALGYVSYAPGHHMSFAQAFQAVDHTQSSWGLPHSGNNVAVPLLNPYEEAPTILFGYATDSHLELDPVRRVSAYFSTRPGVSVTITAYHLIASQSAVQVGSVVIGAPGESWDNRYVEIGDGFQSPFDVLEFQAVGSYDDLSGISFDDLVITPVPEPSSLAALTLALFSAAGAAVARRRRI